MALDLNLLIIKCIFVGIFYAKKHISNNNSKHYNMEKYIYTTLLFLAFLLQGCDKNEIVGSGKGEIHHKGDVYELYNAERIIVGPKKGITLNSELYYSYFHALILESRDRRTSATIIVRSKSDKLESGEFHLRFWTIGGKVFFPTLDFGFYPIENGHNSIRMEINLTDDYVHYANNFGSSVKMKLSVTENGDVFDVELRYVEREDDFFIKYKGLVKDSW
jgi:hypothetical protein